MKPSIRFGVLLVLILLAGVLVNVGSRLCLLHSHTAGQPTELGQAFWLAQELLVLALGDHRGLRSSDCHFDQCIQSERHRCLSALLRDRSSGRFFPLIFRMGHIDRGFYSFVRYWHDS